MLTEPRIYRSSLPLTPVVEESIFTYLMETRYKRYDASGPAFVDADSEITITRAKLKRLALKLGYGLRNHVYLPSVSNPHSLTKLARGDTVMILSSNTMSWPAAVFGCLAAGLKATFAGCSLTPRELSWQWTDSKARVVFVAPDLISVALDMFRLIGISEKEARQRIWVMDQLWDENLPRGVYKSENWMGILLNQGTLSAEEKFDGELANETAYICYSSGTTGRPKGVETTHKNVCTVMEMCKMVWDHVQTEKDVQLGLMPFYHIFGLVMHLNYPFMAGQSCILMLRGFDAEGVCLNVERYGVTTIMLAPPIILTLSLHPGLDDHNMATLKCIASAAAALSPVVAERLLGRLVKQGADVTLIQGCGATETTCPTQMVLPPDHKKKFGSIGQLLPNLELRLVDDDGSDVEEGEAGEVWVRGPTIMRGYLNNPKATADSFAPGQWYKSGDIMRRDGDGYYYIVDRKKEMIKYKGYQVAPAELEAILLENPLIADVGVIGIINEPDKNELPRVQSRAYVTPSDLRILNSLERKQAFEKSIDEWMRGQVAYYKYLRGGVVAVPEIPKSPSGKILRKDLREWAKEELKSAPLRLSTRL
ncbi:Putative acyl-coenzyme A synthetase [Leucoagaricus sp. SymC.cos]|nr:Putative acyl-coenzyme A synthetase [Leucoagaricus sp. SymC.cos]